VNEDRGAEAYSGAACLWCLQIGRSSHAKRRMNQNRERGGGNTPYCRVEKKRAFEEVITVPSRPKLA